MGAEESFLAVGFENFLNENVVEWGNVGGDWCVRGFFGVMRYGIEVRSIAISPCEKLLIFPREQ